MLPGAVPCRPVRYAAPPGRDECLVVGLCGGQIRPLPIFTVTTLVTTRRDMPAPASAPGRQRRVYAVGVTTARDDRHSRTPHLARPGRRAVTVSDLSELHGPTSGDIELPHRLLWQPSRRLNIDHPALLAWMYETVLREATTTDELRVWLHGPTLIRLWSELFLPRGVRLAWEERHPVLRSEAAA